MTSLQLPFRWVHEPRPGPKWAALARRFLPAYHKWYRSEGDARRPDLDSCSAQLAAHMPELVPLWHELALLSGPDDLTRRLLSLYRPPRFVSGCSQAVWTGRPRLLVRNYDFTPEACEGTVLLSAWTGTRVLASLDCLWGVLDGMNEHGLVVALAFGGRSLSGEGFGITLVLRYVLEVCRTTQAAIAVLRRVPSHMAYNVSLLDASGAYAVVQVAPGARARVLPAPVASNHQRELGWPLNAYTANSVAREQYMSAMLDAHSRNPEAFIGTFLREPLFARDYRSGHGTLYTSVYRPDQRTAEFRWPDARIVQSLDGFEEREFVAHYRQAAPAS